MESLTINLRNQVLNKKNLYVNTKRNTIAIDTAVDKALYILNGGTKLIILPPYCDNVTLIAIDILKLIDRQFNFKDDIKSVIDFINKNLTSIDGVSLVDSDTIEIQINRYDKLVVDREDVIDSDLLLEIAANVLVCNTHVEFSDKELKQFKQSLKRIISNRTEEMLCMGMD